MSRPVPRLVRDARHHADDEVVQDGPPAGVARQRRGLCGDADPGAGGKVSGVSRGPRVAPPRHRRRRHGAAGGDVAAEVGIELAEVPDLDDRNAVL
jgi:hypothetical protein